MGRKEGRHAEHGKKEKKGHAYRVARRSGDRSIVKRCVCVRFVGRIRRWA